MMTKRINNILVAGLVCCCTTTALTSCDDLINPALENVQDITEMYNDPTFARGLIDNAFLVLPYDGSSVSDVATDDAVSNDNSNTYKQMATGNWTSQVNPINQWETRYHAIQYCNLFLENIEKVKWDYTSEALNQMHMDLYRGQALALRDGWRTTDGRAHPPEFRRPEFRLQPAPQHLQGVHRPDYGRLRRGTEVSAL